MFQTEGLQGEKSADIVATINGVIQWHVGSGLSLIVCLVFGATITKYLVYMSLLLEVSYVADLRKGEGKLYPGLGIGTTVTYARFKPCFRCRNSCFTRCDYHYE